MLCTLVGRCCSLRAFTSVLRPLLLPVWKPRLLMLLPLADFPTQSFSQSNLSHTSLGCSLQPLLLTRPGAPYSTLYSTATPKPCFSWFSGEPCSYNPECWGICVATGNPPAPTLIPMMAQPSLTEERPYRIAAPFPSPTLLCVWAMQGSVGDADRQLRVLWPQTYQQRDQLDPASLST